MGGSAKIPKQSDDQRKMERLQQELMETQLEAAQRPMEFPEVTPPKPPLPPAPPAGQTSADVAQAEQEARRRALRRTNSARNTLFAGETGGRQKTLLG